MWKHDMLLLDWGKMGVMLLPVHSPLSFASVFPVPTGHYKHSKQSFVLRTNVQKGSAIKPIPRWKHRQRVFPQQNSPNCCLTHWSWYIIWTITGASQARGFCRMITHISRLGVMTVQPQCGQANHCSWGSCWEVCKGKRKLNATKQKNINHTGISHFPGAMSFIRFQGHFWKLFQYRLFLSNPRPLESLIKIKFYLSIIWVINKRNSKD